MNKHLWGDYCVLGWSRNKTRSLLSGVNEWGWGTMVSIQTHRQYGIRYKCYDVLKVLERQIKQGEAIDGQ